MAQNFCMEKILENSKLIVDENEKVIANILHDIKSPLYSIKIALERKQDCELNKDVFETTVNTLDYIENFLVKYNFKNGKFDNKIEKFDIKELINKKIESYKYIFINKNIHIDLILHDEDFSIKSIKIFLSSIIGNIVSNIAFHASKGEIATIEMFKKEKCVCVVFQNFYNLNEHNFNLGLNFCQELTQKTNSQIKITKTKKSMKIELKIPNLKN